MWSLTKYKILCSILSFNQRPSDVDRYHLLSSHAHPIRIYNTRAKQVISSIIRCSTSSCSQQSQMQGVSRKYQQYSSITPTMSPKCASISIFDMFKIIVNPSTTVLVATSALTAGFNSSWQVDCDSGGLVTTSASMCAVREALLSPQHTARV